MKIIYGKKFQKEAYKLEDKYKQIKTDLQDFEKKLLNSSHPLGDRLQQFKGIELYKTRIKNSSAKRGKSGGFRIIYFIKRKDESYYMFSIFSKTEKENMEYKELLIALKEEGIEIY